MKGNKLNKIRNIAVLTSGGDSPGMNACLRSVVRTSVYNGLSVFGVKRGYAGLIEGDIVSLKSENVANILQRGGTFLKSSRSLEFKTKKGREIAYQNILKNRIDGLIVIGGDGTFKGANIFSSEFNIPIIGIPGTIDNDMYGTDSTIGYDTALNTVVSAVDKIRDTANSHNRLFVVEVMGKDAGFIALRTGIGVGAEAILIPETPTYLANLFDKLKNGRRANKTSGIIIVAEGDDGGGAYKVSEEIKSKFDFYDVRVSVLGHLQRGGNPSAYDRVLASRLGYSAVEALISGRNNEMVGVKNSKIIFTPFKKACKYNKNIKKELLDLANILSI